MKNLLTILIVASLLIGACKGYSQQAFTNKYLVGVFDGRTPCQELASQLQQTVTTECIKIKWRLVLIKDSTKNDNNSGTFKLEGFVFRGSNTLLGNWYLTKGTSSDPQAAVYHLQLPLRGDLMLQKGSDNVLFFLDPDKNVRVGNRDFSYTLNRINKT